MKEAETFDTSMNELCNEHWKNATFDGFEVQPLGIASMSHKPPCQIGEEKCMKEAEIFDSSMSELCNEHWKNATFDGLEVQPLGIPSMSQNDHTQVGDFLKAPLRELRTSIYSSYKTEAV